jgi:hypothetical protein
MNGLVDLGEIRRNPRGVPVHLVQCFRCGATYERTGYKANLARSGGCRSCGQRRRLGLPIQPEAACSATAAQS